MDKQYVTINTPCLITTVNVDGVIGVIEFRPRNSGAASQRGIFCTDNQKLQKAIENDSQYGIEFIKVDIILEKDDQKNPKELKIIESVRNRQMAIEWIRKNINKKIPNTTTAKEVYNIAYAEGITFPMWNIRT